jgi:hypothetical protein
VVPLAQIAAPASYLLACAILVLLVRVGRFLRPWRAKQIIVTAVALNVAAAFVAASTVSSPPWVSLAWWALLLAGALFAILVHATLYVRNRRRNVLDVRRVIDRARFDRVSVLWRHLKERPQLSPGDIAKAFWHPQPHHELEAEAHDAMRHCFRLLEKPVTLPGRLSWTEDPHHDPSWNFLLHNMGYVASLAHVHHATGRYEFLERAQELVLSWIRGNSAYVLRPPSAFSWGDHSTAIRLANWLVFWEVWARSATVPNMRLVLGSMLAHAARLADPGFYTPGHNHGFDQDRALLAFSARFPELTCSAGWRDLALQRIASQIEWTISPRGVHLEHSPGYHMMAMVQMEALEHALALFGLHHQLRIDVAALKRRMARFAALLFRPDGHIAMLGDSRHNTLANTHYSRVLSQHAHECPELRAILSRGSAGELPSGMVSYPAEGYVIIRDDHERALRFDHAFYLLFAAAAHRGRGHKHSDDLSFVLSYGGHEFVADAGYYSYKRDPWRDYFVGARAHNVVLVDDHAFTGWETRIEAVHDEPGLRAVVATHCNHPGFEHHRCLVHLRPSTVVLIDDMRPLQQEAAPHTFCQQFQLSHDMRVDLSDMERGIDVMPEEGSETVLPVMKVLQLGSQAIEASCVAGSRNPILGWLSPDHGMVVGAPMLRFQQSGDGAIYVTVLDLSMPSTGASPPRSHYDADVLPDAVTVHWLEDGAMHALRISRTGSEVTRHVQTM